MLEAPADQRFEEAGQLRDAMRTVKARAPAEDGVSGQRRDVLGVKVGASGAVVQVFIVSGRVIERVEFVWDAAESGESGRRRRSRDSTVLRGS